MRTAAIIGIEDVIAARHDVFEIGIVAGVIDGDARNRARRE